MRVCKKLLTKMLYASYYRLNKSVEEMLIANSKSEIAHMILDFRRIIADSEAHWQLNN